jgi:choline-sulfatase
LVVASAVIDAGREAGPPAFAIPKDLDVLLITIDCLRADMPWVGYERDIAPNLTKLAKKSVVYTNAYSMSSYTSMSLGGFLGGKLSSELERDGYFFSTYAPKDLFFPEVLQAAGMHTMTAHAHGYFRNSGFNQGFDVFEMVPDLKWNTTTDENITSPQLEAIAEKQLGDPQNAQKRFFAWFHFLDPHDMYLRHEGIDFGKNPRDLYDGEVLFTDRYIGKLIDFVEQQPYGKKTAIIVTADHGEAFGEHGMQRHGFEVWEPLVRVPLMFYIPGITPRTIDVRRSAIDMAPTILDLYGLPREPTFEGTSLVPDLLGKCGDSTHRVDGGGADPSCAERDVVVDLPSTSDSDKHRAYYHGMEKLIDFGTKEYLLLFDLAADPEEAHPISRGDAYTAMVERYRAFKKTVVEIPPTGCKEGCIYGTTKPDAGAAPTSPAASASASAASAPSASPSAPATAKKAKESP